MPGLVFHDAWEAAGDGEAGFTWTNANPWARQDLEPDRRIDYVFAAWPGTGGAGPRDGVPAVGQAIDGVFPSDHLGVLAELRYWKPTGRMLGRRPHRRDPAAAARGGR